MLALNSFCRPDQPFVRAQSRRIYRSSYNFYRSPSLFLYASLDFIFKYIIANDRPHVYNFSKWFFVIKNNL